MGEKMKELLNRIGELDKAAMEQTKQRCDSRTKPLGSLGELEQLVARRDGDFWEHRRLKPIGRVIK